MALNGRDTAKYLPKTYNYWFDKFVGPTYGEVWVTVVSATGRPLAGDLPKQWPWKNGYHSLEHALVGYIGGQQLGGEAVRLFYAHEPDTARVRPYYFEGRVEGVERVMDGVWRVDYREVR